jgi:lathosterol oxidase
MQPLSLCSVPTPFSAYAFHPVDGYLQAMPYHICAHFMFPMHKMLFLGLFGIVNLWTIAVRYPFQLLCSLSRSAPRSTTRT